MTDGNCDTNDSLVSVEELTARLKTAASCDLESETVALEVALGRVLAEQICSDIDIPPHANAAVDGFAFCHAELNSTGESRLPVSATIRAGDAPVRLQAQSCAQIMTGAPLPEGADTVVMQEEVKLVEGIAHFDGDIEQGINWRPAGEDVSHGESLYPVGTKLSAPDLGMLSALGIQRIRVKKKLSVALLSTGDEILDPGQPLSNGTRYDANRPMLASYLQGQGHAITDLGIVADDPFALRTVLTDAAQRHNVILTSGGASTSSADHMMPVVRELGEVFCWRVAVKPGRPLGFGQISQTPIIALPGNPVAVGVCTLMFVFPFLGALSGQAWRTAARYRLPAGFSLRKRKGRTEYVRAVLSGNTNNTMVHKHPKQGSGVLSSLCQADGLVELLPECEEVVEGDMISFIPLNQFC